MNDVEDKLALQGEDGKGKSKKVSNKKNEDDKSVMSATVFEDLSLAMTKTMITEDYTTSYEDTFGNQTIDSSEVPVVSVTRADSIQTKQTIPTVSSKKSSEFENTKQFGGELSELSALSPEEYTKKFGDVESPTRRKLGEHPAFGRERQLSEFSEEFTMGRPPSATNLFAASLKEMETIFDSSPSPNRRTNKNQQFSHNRSSKEGIEKKKSYVQPKKIQSQWENSLRGDYDKHSPSRSPNHNRHRKKLSSMQHNAHLEEIAENTVPRRTKNKMASLRSREFHSNSNEKDSSYGGEYFSGDERPTGDQTDQTPSPKEATNRSNRSIRRKDDNNPLHRFNSRVTFNTDNNEGTSSDNGSLSDSVNRRIQERKKIHHKKMIESDQYSESMSEQLSPERQHHGKNKRHPIQSSFGRTQKGYKGKNQNYDKSNQRAQNRKPPNSSSTLSRGSTEDKRTQHRKLSVSPDTAPTSYAKTRHANCIPHTSPSSGSRRPIHQKQSDSSDISPQHHRRSNKKINEWPESSFSSHTTPRKNLNSRGLSSSPRTSNRSPDATSNIRRINNIKSRIKGAPGHDDDNKKFKPKDRLKRLELDNYSKEKRNHGISQEDSFDAGMSRERPSVLDDPPSPSNAQEFFNYLDEFSAWTHKLLEESDRHSN